MIRSPDGIVDHCCTAWEQLADQPRTFIFNGLLDSVGNRNEISYHIVMSGLTVKSVSRFRVARP